MPIARLTRCCPCPVPLKVSFDSTIPAAAATLALVILVQQLENYVLVPKIMERSVGVSPIATLLAIAIGAELAGVFGVLISVPVYITARVFYQQYFSTKK